MKLSVVIICWNDLKVIQDCISSIFAGTTQMSFEVIVSDNGSTDDSVQVIGNRFPCVKLVKNRENLGFARGNNAGIRIAQGEYVLILNPDTIVHEGALDRLIVYADRQPEAGAFGCRVLNSDGSNQGPARPLPTLGRGLIAALYLRFLARMWSGLSADEYIGWDGRNEREIGFQSGCCLLFRREVLIQLGAFDPRFFYHFEETDLCKRVWDAGKKVLFCPEAEITHLGGQSVGRFPIRFALETCRSRYRYFYKHFGPSGARRIRWVWLLHIGLRFLGYQTINWWRRDPAIQQRLDMYRVILRWNWLVDPVKFNFTGEEPDLGYAPMALVAAGAAEPQMATSN